MADTDSATQSRRQAVVARARLNIACHYVWGAAGNVPGQSDGAWYRPAAARMHDLVLDPRGDRRYPNLHQPIMYAAWCRVDGDKVCAGRTMVAEVKTLAKGDTLNMTPPDPSLYSWPRPSGVINAPTKVYGESCFGVRHFDCIGFVNYCISVAHKPVWFSIPNCINQTQEVPLTDTWAGDILTIGESHIGIATGNGMAVHARSTEWGVCETAVAGGGWGRCGRFASYFWRA